MTRWRPEYDELIVRYHGFGLSDYEMLCRMLDQNLPVANHDVALARKRLGLTRHIKQQQTHQKDPTPFKDKINPMPLARHWLGIRLVEKSSGYWLDGLPVNLNEVMRALNRLLQDDGCQQIVSNEQWRV